MNARKFIIVLLLILFGSVAHAEYGMVDDIVYWFNNELSTAWVQNIRSTSSSVTIHSFVNYRGVKYEVVGLEKNDFNTSAINTYNTSSAILGDGFWTDVATLSAIEKEEMERPFRYDDYDYYRANITTLNLPNTLLTIGEGAFDGMRSLQSITIPFSVIKLPNGIFQQVFTDYLPNLQSITILGLPTFKKLGEEISITSKDDEGNYNYEELVKEKFNLKYCRNLKTFRMPEYEKRLPVIRAFDKANNDLEKETEKINSTLKEASIPVPALKDEACTDVQTIQEAYNQARQYLNVMFKSCKNYELLYDSLTNLLKQHPYYDGTALTFQIPVLDPQEPLTSLIAALSKKYKAELWEEYNELVGGKMEYNLQINHPNKYVAGYITLHPDKKDFIEGLIYKEYRCEDSKGKYKYILAYIERGTLTQTCRQRQWTSYNHLFDSKENFDKVYDEAKTDYEFKSEISRRETAYSKLEGMKKYVPNHIKKINVSNINKKPNEESYEIIKVLNSLEKSYYYDKAVSYLIQTLPKVQKEYEKNGQYFKSETEFFKAYSSDSYSRILKENKKKISLTNKRTRI